MITYHDKLEQGSPEWLAARCGLITASEVHKIITPTLKVAANAATKTHLYELLAQRVTGYTEPHFEGYHTERGHIDEFTARELYRANISPVTECGFVTNDEFGFTLGYSPDGLVGDNGLIECKSRLQKYQMQTLIEHVEKQTMPNEFLLQVQTGLIVTQREWCDFLSYCGGMDMPVIRIYADKKVQSAITTACAEFEEKIAEFLAIYHKLHIGDNLLIPTKRIRHEFGEL